MREICAVVLAVRSTSVQSIKGAMRKMYGVMSLPPFLTPPSLLYNPPSLNHDVLPPFLTPPFFAGQSPPPPQKKKKKKTICFAWIAYSFVHVTNDGLTNKSVCMAWQPKVATLDDTLASPHGLAWLVNGFQEVRH
jgi:hypothetical protein